MLTLNFADMHLSSSSGLFPENMMEQVNAAAACVSCAACTNPTAWTHSPWDHDRPDNGRTQPERADFSIQELNHLRGAR